MKRSLPSDFRAKNNLLVFVDECHRAQSGTLHKAIKDILPDAVRKVQEKLRKIQHDVSTGRFADAGDMTVKEWLTTWLETAKGRIAPKTHLCPKALP